MQAFRMDGQTVLVTGAARGIGLATARALLAMGARVALLDLPGEALQSAGAGLGDDSESHVVRPADVTSREEIEAAVSRLNHEWGRIDALVNAAGIHELVPITQLTPAQFERTMQVNVMGVYHCTQAVLPLMMEQRAGAIVNLASLAGRRGHPTGGAHYAASKGAVIAFTRSVAREVASFGIRANCVAPGMTETRMVGDFTPEEKATYARAIPLGRIGQPEEIADVVAFLCAGASRYMTGQVLQVCGGVLMA